MTDAQAQDYLKNECNEKSSKLMSYAAGWFFYSRVVDWRLRDLSKSQEEYINDVFNRYSLAAAIAKEIKTAKERVCVFMGAFKGFRTIHLPLLSENDEVYPFEHSWQPEWSVQVYLHPEETAKAKKVKALTKEKLASLG